MPDLPGSNPTPTRPADVMFVTLSVDNWRAALLEKVELLRREGKPVMLLIDGARVFVYRAEKAGTLKLD